MEDVSTSQSIDPASPPSEAGESASVTAALERMLSAVQQVVANAIHLVGLDVAAAMQRAIVGLLLAALGIVLVCCGWVALMGVILALPGNEGSMFARLSLVAALNLAAGVAALLVSARRIRESRSVANGVNHDRR